MKKELISLILSSILLVGCGGSDNDSNGQQTTNPDTNNPDTSFNPKTLTEEQKLAMASSVFGILIRETLSVGAIDTIKYAMDDLIYYYDVTSCSSGSFKKVGDTYTFDQCTGIFENDEDTVANGTIIVSNNSYDVQNFSLSYTNGEVQTFNGKFNNQVDNGVGGFTSDEFKVNVKKIDSSNQVLNELYVFSDYKYVWTNLDADSSKIQIQGKLKSSGTAYGDYKVVFDNFYTPFLIYYNGNELTDGYPISGVLTITDSEHNLTTTVNAINTESAAQVKATDNGKVISDKITSWDDMPNFHL